MKEKKKKKKESLPFFDRANIFLGKYDLACFWILFGITALVSILLFDPRVSPGGDDSGYILSAHDFLEKFKFPAFQAPLYPVALSLVDMLFGMSVKAFKIFSMLCILSFFFLTFKAYRRHTPPLLLFITLLLTSVNSHVLYFASQTYSEAFYMLMQSLLPLVFFRYFVNTDDRPVSFAANIRRHLLLAAVILGIILARNIGYAAFLAVAAWFVFYKRWKDAGYAVVCFAFCMIVFQLLKSLIWKDSGLHGSEQMSTFLLKDFYHPEYGRETVTGFLQRFWDNSNQYLSRFFFAMLGLRDTFTSEGVYLPVKPVLTVIVYALGLVFIFFTHRRNRNLFFAGLFTGSSIVATFFIIHTFWNQQRMIVTAFPYLLMALFGALYHILELKRLSRYQLLILLPVVWIFFTSLSDTSQAVKEAQKLTNEYSGLTPDWRNYLKASAWVGENLPEETFVGCRQPAISSIYAKGKRFYRIGRVNSGNFQSFMDRWSSGEDMAVVNLRNVPNDLYRLLAGYYEARLLIGQEYYMAVNTSAPLEDIINRQQGMQIFYSPEGLQPAIREAGNQLSVFYADSLLAPLKNNAVTHLLRARLRMNPRVKDGNTINTVERMVIFIQEKYPTVFSVVKQFGDPADEPADIVRINWEVTSAMDD
jgi:hypothetical protein